MLLIREIRILEMELGCVLDVIHVPGLLMIDQGTDGLSRGVVMHPLSSQNGTTSLADIFRPALVSPALLQRVF